MENEQLESGNKSTMLDILDNLRHRVASDEILQIFVAIEDPSGFDCEWSDSEDRVAMGGFVLSSAIARMGFVRAQATPASDSD